MLNKLVGVFTITFLLISSFQGFTQDPHFSQYYANPLYLNPGLTGSTECGRINLNYRNQWPSLGNAFVTYSASYDQSVPFISSGLGFTFVSDKTGDGSLSKNHISGYYAYKLKISQTAMLSMGFQATYTQQSLDWNKLVFGDQINPGTGTTNPSTQETPPESMDISYLDFSTGAVFDYNNVFFAGVAVQHLTQPDDGFYNNSDSKLPMRITLHGGATYNLTRGEFGYYEQGDWTISPNLLFMQQESFFKELNIGAYVNKDPFIAGVWFRNSFNNSDAAIIVVGIKHNNYRIGYNYDITLSKLADISGGAHEISFAYEFCILKDEKRRRIRTIKVPSF